MQDYKHKIQMTFYSCLILLVQRYRDQGMIYSTSTPRSQAVTFGKSGQEFGRNWEQKLNLKQKRWRNPAYHRHVHRPN